MQRLTEQKKMIGAILLGGLCLGVNALISAAELIPPKEDDVHETEVGYWDIHVCNWPDRPAFYLTMLITERYEDLKRAEVFLPDGRVLGELALDKYLTKKRNGQPDLRIYVTHLPMHPERPEGWYSVRIKLNDGRQYLAKDFQLMHTMERVSAIEPAPQSDVTLPEELSWQPVPGAQYYKVWIRDMWQDGKEIYASDNLSEPRLELPEGLLEPGGWYSWRIHARDTHKHVLLGWFNHGSLTDWWEFTTRD